MDVFSSSSSRSLVLWGPTAGVTVIFRGFDVGIDDSWILTNMSVGAREIVDIRQCFNDVSFIYALGNKQESCEMSLTFAVFIGKKSPGCKSTPKDNTKAIAAGMGSYKKIRIYEAAKGSKTPTEVTIGDFTRKGWITGIDINNMDAYRGICYGTVYFNMEL